MMIESVLQTITGRNMLVRGDRVVCATSGGADSVAMLRALCILQSELQIKVFACHLNHGLRGEESDRDENFVRTLCDELGVSLYCEKVKIEGKSGVEERAREARYAFFERATGFFNADKIATAHNAEDNLETLIFNLARGSGLDGLCGIPPVRDNIVRPLIYTPKAEIISFLEELGQNWVEDSSNKTDDYTRNLIRHKILPVMSKINGEAVRNSSRAIKNITADSEYLNEIAKGYLTEEALDVSLGKLPNAVLSRIIRLNFEQKIKNGKRVLDFRAVCDIMDLIRSEKKHCSITLSKDLQVSREGDKVYFVTNCSPLRPIILKKGQQVQAGEYKITCNCDEIIIRPRRDGDKIKLCGRRTRLVKKILCDEKVPKHLRDQIPIIERNDEIIALCGFGFADGAEKGSVSIEHNA